MGGQSKDADLARFHYFYRAADFIADPLVFNEERTQIHIAAMSFCAQHLGRRLREVGVNIDLIELESRAWYQNLGQVMSLRPLTHRNIGAQLLTAAGFQVRFAQELKAAAAGKRRTLTYSTSFANEHPEDALLLLADNLSIYEGVRLRRWEDSPSDSNKRKLDQIRMWIEEKLGQPIDQTSKELESELRRWRVISFREANRNLVLPFKSVVFDIGGVIKYGIASLGDEKLLQRIAQIYQINDPQSLEKLAEYFNQWMMEAKIGAQTFSDLAAILAEIFGKVDEAGEDLVAEDNGFVDPIMIRVINYLKVKGVRVVLATNTIPRHWRGTTQDFRRVGLAHQRMPKSLKNEGLLDTDVIPVFTSFDLGVRKGGTGESGKFFQKLFSHSGLDPDSTWVVDDNQSFAQEAAAVGAKGYHFKTPGEFVVDLISPIY